MSQNTQRSGVHAETHFRMVFDASPDAILIVDDAGVIIEANDTTLRMFGYAEDDLVGQPVEILIPRSRHAAHERQRTEYLESPHARPMGIGMELKGLTRNGTEVPVEVSLSPFDEQGRTFIVASVRDITDRTQARAFRAAAIRAAENERARVARELHDDTAQRLAAAIIQLRLVGRAAEGEREERAGELRRELMEIAEGVRRIARGLRPPELDEVGLRSAVENWSRTITEGQTLKVRVDADVVDDQLSRDQRLVLYRVVQEALSNVKRHSGATDAHVQIVSENGRIVASVRDNGTGFDPELALSQVRGLGLHGMNERAAMIGARLRIASELAGGTEVRLEIDPGEGMEVRS